MSSIFLSEGTKFRKTGPPQTEVVHVSNAAIVRKEDADDLSTMEQTWNVVCGRFTGTDDIKITIIIRA